MSGSQSDPIYCAACHSELQPTDSACPICLRPRSRSEIMHDIVAARKAPALRRRALRRRVLWAAAALCAGWLAWRGGAAGQMARFGRWMARDRDALGLTDARPSAGSPQPVPTASARPQPIPAAPSVAKAVLSAAPPPQPKRPPAPVVADAQAAPEPSPAAGKKRLYGVVYDLATKKPVVSARLTFHPEQRSMALGTLQATTDPAGHFLMDMPFDMDQLTVMAESQGYAGNLEDSYPPLRQLSVAQRRAFLARRDDYGQPVRVLFTAGQELIPLDIVLVPQNWLSAPAP